MIARVTFISIILLYLAGACKRNHRTEPDYDKVVMQEIFPSLLDSLYVEITFTMTPPRIMEVADSRTGQKKLTPVEKGPTERAAIRNDLGTCEQEPHFILAVLRDTVHALSTDDLEKFRSTYPLSKETTRNIHLQMSYPLSLNELTPRKCFKLILSSVYPPVPADSIRLVRQLKEISFSRIVFDADRVHGMLTCEYVCGGLCGTGYRVYIRKTGGKWTIQFIEHAWIA